MNNQDQTPDINQPMGILSSELVKVGPSRLEVMMSIQHDDEYYIAALEQKGVDYRQLTHEEISWWKATIKAIEADILIQASETLSPYTGNCDSLVEKLEKGEQ